VVLLFGYVSHQDTPPDFASHSHARLPPYVGTDGSGEYVLIAPMISFVVLMCFDTLDFGVRYLLPLYPFLSVWLSRVIVLGLSGPHQRARTSVHSSARNQIPLPTAAVYLSSVPIPFLCKMVNGR
jgi:hypothetical protein